MKGNPSSAGLGWIKVNQFLPRDFIETKEGLVFAVVDPVLESGRILCSLRYRREAGGFRKLSTESAETVLDREMPDYLFLSHRCAARIHGVPMEHVVRHHRAETRIRELLASVPKDAIEAAARACLQLFASEGLPLDRLGVSGSLLMGAQRPDSDIDFVAYDRDLFRGLQGVIRQAMADGRMTALDSKAWQEAHARRGCPLSFEDYQWHERRKANKALMLGIKLDITLVHLEEEPIRGAPQKKGWGQIEAKILDAERGYDTPARFILEHPDIREILVFTQTYVGQARNGETVWARGQMEEDEQGIRRLVVGTNREAVGEYIMVIDGPCGGCPSSQARSFV